MILKTIAFEPVDDEQYPARISVEMTIEEATWIAAIAGKCSGDSPHHGIYDCLVGDVFNRYWDDGVDEAMKMLGIKIPNIGAEPLTPAKGEL